MVMPILIGGFGNGFVPIIMGPAVDSALFSLHLAGVSSISGTINCISTIFNMRARGLTLSRMFVLTTIFFLLLLLPVLARVLQCY